MNVTPSAAACLLLLLGATSEAVADDGSRWTGAYVGLGIGALGVQAQEFDQHTFPAVTDKFSSNTSWGAVGSVTAGYSSLHHISSSVLLPILTLPAPKHR